MTDLPLFTYHLGPRGRICNDFAEVRPAPQPPAVEPLTIEEYGAILAVVSQNADLQDCVCQEGRAAYGADFTCHVCLCASALPKLQALLGSTSCGLVAASQNPLPLVTRPSLIHPATEVVPA